MKILLIILIVFAMLILVGKRILFPRYDEIEVTGKYEIGCEDYWVTEDKEDPFFNNRSLREVQVRVWYPQNYEDPNTKLPVVIASHGSCGTIDNNRSLYREFASHGYVVLAGMLNQAKSKVEPGEQLKKLNKDCLDFSGDFH